MTGEVEGVLWKKFLRKHWRVFAVFAIAAAAVSVGAVYVFYWFAGDAVSSGLVPSSLGGWTMGNLIAFILNLIFWELFIIGIPTVIAGIVAWRWWTRVPMEERRFHFGGRKRSTGSGGGSLLFFIVFCIKVYVDGKWNVAIATWTLDYVVGSVITILIWAAIIIGIPAAIAIVWWLRREMKKA